MNRYRLPVYGEVGQEPPSLGAGEGGLHPVEGADHYLGPAGGGECQKESWNERIHGMFNNQEMADIRFAVNDGTAHVVFKAHKFLLAVRSPVFHTMFYGALRETREEISVPDVAPSAFRAMLVYLYRDVTSLQSLQAAWQLWYAAKKYMLYSLEAACRKYVESNMNPLNVLETYVFAENYGDQHLVYQCLRLIDRHASHILSSSSFPSLPAGLVTNIVARATLSSTEIEVFEALVRWSQAEIQRHLDCDEEVEVPSLTSVAAPLLAHVRFGAISSQEFVHRVLPRGVLDMADISKLASEIKRAESPSGGAEAGLGAGSPARDWGDLGRLMEAKLGLNQAGDLLNSDTGGGASHSHAEPSVHRHQPADASRRLGPGYYQATRSTGNQDMKVLREFPASYRLTVTVTRGVYIMGVCVSEADGHFLPKLRFSVQLRDAEDKLLAEGVEKVAKQFCNSCNSPLDVTLKQPFYVSPGTEYRLVLNITNNEDPWSVSPLLLPHCLDTVDSFGVGFTFRADHKYSASLNKLVPLQDDDQEVGEDREDQASSPFGLISRLYFFF